MGAPESPFLYTIYDMSEIRQQVLDPQRSLCHHFLGRVDEMYVSFQWDDWLVQDEPLLSMSSSPLPVGLTSVG